MNLTRLEQWHDKTVLVTGAASGMGFALSALLLERGASVELTDQNPVTLERAFHDLQNLYGTRVHWNVLDVRDFAAVAAAVADACTRWGKLDAIFNNAGIGGTLPFAEGTLEHWQKIMNVNLWGVIHGTRAAYLHMREQGFGQIVNTASISGLLPVPGQTLYNTTKFAIVGLSTTLRYEAAEHGIQVNVVCPGLVRTNIFGVPILGESDPTALAPSGAIDALVAAERILHGVACNHAKIVFPLKDRRAERMYRHRPWLIDQVFQTWL